MPETKYADSDGVSIAYQVIGDGPIDLVCVPGFISHLEFSWELPAYARFLGRLASFSRLIMFDKRGTGLSDRVSDKELPTLEQRMDDVRAVMDAVGSRRAALFGVSEGGPMCALFAATYPERTAALAMYGAYAVGTRAPGYPWARTPSQWLATTTLLRNTWGGSMAVRYVAPSMARDKQFKHWFAANFRSSASPGAAASFMRMNAAVDIRNILPAISTPTLVLHRRDDPVCHVREGRFLADRIAGARFVELPGRDHYPMVGDSDAILDEVEEFVTGARSAHGADRVLATVLFTDIVDSTARAAQLGDRKWRDLLEAHNAVVRRELGRFRGREVNTEGDSFLATFDGPARAIRCASAIVDSVRQIGLDVRAGLHTGECELMGDDIGGIAVHIGARVKAQARPGEVLVSSTVKDLVAGSGIEFRSRGAHTLKGVPDEWCLFAVSRS
jgi:pimeloyl-ACP methyl ester carboxylesterase